MFPLPHRASFAALFLALSVAVPPHPAAASPAARFDFSPVNGCGPNNLEGWEFQTTAAISVSALGVFDSNDDGLQFAVPVGLYDASCALLASVTVPAGSAATLHDHYRYAAIAPLNLPSGQTFRIAAVMHCDDYTAAVQNLDDVSLDAAVSYVRTRRIGFEDMLACPTEMTSGNYFDFTPNFQIGPPCGNGVIETGEQCDDANAIDDDCCSLDCKPAQAGVPCAEDGLTCTADVCDAGGTCTHAPGNAGAECSPAEDDCHFPDRCDGESDECPELDERKDPGAPCTDDGLFCTGAERCGEAVCESSGDPCDGTICDEDADQCVTATPTITSTPAATATRTLSPTPLASPTGTISATPVSSASHTPTPPSTPTDTFGTMPPATDTPGQLTPTLPSVCVGDCDRDGNVTINELITGVGIALGSQALEQCESFDASRNGAVEINELIAAVNAALDGCD
jgi:cysteine-rich repeat protein